MAKGEKVQTGRECIRVLVRSGQNVLDAADRSGPTRSNADDIKDLREAIREAGDGLKKAEAGE